MVLAGGNVVIAWQLIEIYDAVINEQIICSLTGVALVRLL